MNSREKKPGKELYRQLRALTWQQLWEVEVPRFDRASLAERLERVAVVRALGVVVSESGTPAQRELARPWLRRLLQDPSEKIRRYAMEALPKLGAGPGEESEMLALLRNTPTDREKKFLGRALGKIGGSATLSEMNASGGDAGGVLRQTEQKVKARLARDESPGSIDLEGILTEAPGLGIHLRGRRGLEPIVAAEVRDRFGAGGRFRIDELHEGLVVLTALAAFSLADLLQLRCFDTVGLVLGTVTSSDEARSNEELAAVIASPRSQRILQVLNRGTIRYRLDFAEMGHQRAAVRSVADRVYELCPRLLNDPTAAPWTIAIHPSEHGATVELVPKLTPDPRRSFRLGDIPAASHPPLAACMVRLAGPMENEVVWDPFCGSGLELIERALLGGVRRVIGTDLSPEALAICRRNFDAAHLANVEVQFTQGDFRDHARIPGLGPESATLIITNPPMGRRIAIPDLRGLIESLLSVAATVLKPGGRLVFPNPLRIGTLPPALQLVSTQTVDLGGFDCQLELYHKPLR